MVFVMVAFVIMLVPFVGMLWAPTVSTSENRELADAPSLVDENGAPNLNMLADWGAYFEDHFAYRNELVASNAALRSLLGVSSTDQVVLGTDGWLYYGGTLADYLGKNELSDRALFNIAHSLSMLQNYVHSRGAEFVLAIAPNKNSLYPEHMPSYYLATPNASNWERLKPLLDKEGVAYVDLFEVLGNAESRLYYLRDSHWTNKGALLAANALLAALGRAPIEAPDGSWIERDDWLGDLESMLHPVWATAEPAVYTEGINDGDSMSGSRWGYTVGSDVTDDEIETVGPGGGRLLMYRDSFGNALLPYLSTAFRGVRFSKLIPYNALEIDRFDADCVVVERAERHLEYLAYEPAIMPSPRLRDAIVSPTDGASQALTLEIAERGPFYELTGELDASAVSPNCRIAIAVRSADGSDTVYEAIPVSLGDQGDDGHWSGGSDYGYRAYVHREAMDPTTDEIIVFSLER